MLTQFKESLKKIVDPAIALREAGTSMEAIKAMMKSNFKPHEEEQKKEETLESPMPDANSDTFMTEGREMEADEEMDMENELDEK